MIIVKRLTKRYRARGLTIDALRDVSFTIGKGETFGLVGASGSGKTTLGKSILGLVPVDSGEVIINGKKWDELSRRDLKKARQEAQMVFQHPMSSLNPRMQVIDLIAEPMKVHRCGGVKEAYEWLDRVELSDRFAHVYPSQLSGGARQRVAIARALAAGPKFVVFDEAIAALDASVQAGILNLLIQLKSDLNLTYLFISHNLNIVRFLSDRIAVMRGGRIVEIAQTESLFSKPLHPYSKDLLASLKPAEKTTNFPLTPSSCSGEGEYNFDGCPFFQQCPRQDDICEQAFPPLREIEPNHFVACHDLD